MSAPGEDRIPAASGQAGEPADHRDSIGSFGREAAERPAPPRPPRAVAPPPKPPVDRARIVRVSIALAVLVAIAVAGWAMLIRPVSDVPAGQAVQVDVPRGATDSRLGDLLAERGVVASPLMFRIQARLAGASGRFRAGTYDLTTGSDYRAVIERLLAGPPISYVKITIPEGWTVAQIAKRVEAEAGVPAADFTRLASTGAREFHYAFLDSDTTGSLEGYLFPKTYRIRSGSSAKEIIDVMLRQFGKETEGLDLTYARAHGVSLHGLVTIASMIERETKVARDRPLVSSVIYNRLARGMYLEIDATVQYAVGGKPRLLYSDLQVNSPYNTYLHKGLPPGPIASPGRASLEAAAAPTSTRYLYYVLTHRDGTHTFTDTKAAFEALKARAKRGLQ